jgi:phosphate butyryltransferase
MAVVAAADRHTLEAVAFARRDGIADPIMIGDRMTIKSYMAELGFPAQNARIIDAPSHEEAAMRAVKLINDGEADFIMKGLVETATLMKVIVSKESNLRTGGIMSHLAFLEIPTYHKLLAITDAALNTYPTLEQKRQIIENAVAAMARMGIVNPKVAVMAAAEEVNPKIAESVEAHALKVMNLSGELSGCIVEGPIAYDLAVDKEAALVKKYMSPVAGDADLLWLPT